MKAHLIGRYILDRPVPDPDANCRYCGKRHPITEGTIAGVRFVTCPNAAREPVILPSVPVSYDE